MKRTKDVRWVNTLVLLVMLIGVILLPEISVNAGLKDSAHDFSNQGWSQGRICLPCHTPHHADMTVTGAPLWNHAVTQSEHSPYSSSSMTSRVMQPVGISRLCLSCHDGTMAIDSFGGVTGTTALYSTRGNLGLRGMSMMNDHPVSFRYDTALALADGELFDPVSTDSGLGHTIAVDLLHDGSLECSSCHDVHDTQSQGNLSLLRITAAGSRICLTCHAKE